MRTVIREGHWWNESSRMSNVFKIERNFEKFKKYSLLSDEILREYTEQTLLFKSFDEIFDDSTIFVRQRRAK